ncbi:YSIRK-type signal peptide-containing protein [Flavobacterium sp. 28A]
MSRSKFDFFLTVLEFFRKFSVGVCSVTA